jgi:hypothetical protein
VRLSPRAEARALTPALSRERQGCPGKFYA